MKKYKAFYFSSLIMFMIELSLISIPAIIPIGILVSLDDKTSFWNFLLMGISVFVIVIIVFCLIVCILNLVIKPNSKNVF